MSTESSQTTYQFNLRVNMTEITFGVYTSDGMTDSMAFALKNAWLNLGWPAGTDLSASVGKRTLAETDYTEDDTTTPPSFT